MPVMLRLRAEAMAKFSYDSRIRIGAAGGLGTPDAVAAAFVLGADFVVTGSVNQCTVEAGTSEAVKDLLETMDVQDTAYAPAGDMFELGAKVQVLRKGMFFPARANKLYELYMRHASLEEIPAKTLQQIEEKFFRRSCDEVWRETRAYLQRTAPAAIDALERNPKQKMASIFKWYFVQSTRLALQGVHDRKVDFQVQCGPALGAFNKWAQGTPLERWRQRGVAQIAEALMTGAAQVLNERYGRFARTRSRRRGQPAAELAT